MKPSTAWALTGGVQATVRRSTPRQTRASGTKTKSFACRKAVVPPTRLLGDDASRLAGADPRLARLAAVGLAAQAGVEVPTGAVTTVFGAVFVVILALRMSDAGMSVAGDALARLRSRRFFLAVLVSLVVLFAGLLVAGALLGDAKLLLGDLANWLTGQSGDRVSAVLGTRLPRVTAAVLAGAALAIAGALIQAVSRNSLAEPGILGVSGGGGLVAIVVITTVPAASSWLVTGSALLGAALAALLVSGLAFRGGLQQNCLVRIGVSAGLAALITVLLVTTDPYNQTKALTWLSGSTYGLTFAFVLPPLAALVLALPVLSGLRRDLDLIAVDDDSPRVLGIGLSGSRVLLLSVAELLTAGAVSSVGVIAPAQIPAGIMAALVGAAYFVYLLWRSRVDRTT